MRRVFVFLGILLMAASASAETVQSLQTAFLQGNHDQVVQSAERAAVAGALEPDTVLYLKGMSAFKLQDLPLAQTSFRQLLSQYPSSRWYVFAWIALGDAFRYSGDMDRALQIYQDLQRTGQATAMEAPLLLRLMQAHFKMGQWTPARAQAQTLLDRYPGTSESQLAKQLLERQDFFFSVQVGAFGNKANALKLKAELSRRGFSAKVLQTTQQNKVFHRVRVGELSNRSEAEVLAKRLREEGFPTRIFP